MANVAVLTPPYLEIYGTGILLVGESTGAWQDGANLLNHVYSETVQVAWVWPNGVETVAAQTYDLPSTGGAWVTLFSFPIHVVENQTPWAWAVRGVSTGGANGALRLYDATAAAVLDTITLPGAAAVTTQAFTWGNTGDRVLKVQIFRKGPGAASFTGASLYYDTVPI